jgi:general secretion pathway protein D
VATQSYEYKDVGTTLRVTPQISSVGTVRLKIYEEVSRIVSTKADLGNNNIALAPTTNKRSAEARVEVQNGQTVVIAGLLGSDMDNTDNKVPALGDIPGLGWLFKARNRISSKTNLLVFLTPHIVETVDDAKAIYASKVDRIDILKLGDDGRAQAKLKPPVLAAPAVAR